MKIQNLKLFMILALCATPFTAQSVICSVENYSNGATSGCRTGELNIVDQGKLLNIIRTLDPKKNYTVNGKFQVLDKSNNNNVIYNERFESDVLIVRTIKTANNSGTLIGKIETLTGVGKASIEIKLTNN